MELIFTKQADRWVAEFIANNDFNLHIEGVVEGNVSLFQRGSESGNYAFVKDGTPHPSYANVYDYDFAALIYPKFIKVSCATEPTSGIVTSNGEITEIKAQTKEIEVTENGTTEVTPDAGFSYLNSVKVKTNVASSGGGSGDTMEYFIVKDAGEYGEVLCASASYYKAQVSNDPLGMMIAPYTNANADFLNESELIIAVGVDFKSKLLALQDDTTMEMTMMDYFSSLGVSTDAIANIPRITKEDFFTLPKDVTVNDKDQEKLKEVYEGIVDLYIRRGLPIYGVAREAVILNEPLVYFNYRSLSIYWEGYNSCTNPARLYYYGVAQEYDGYNNWYDIAKEDVVSCDMLEFSNCWIYKLTRTNGKVVYTLAEKIS